MPQSSGKLAYSLVLHPRKKLCQHYAHLSGQLQQLSIWKYKVLLPFQILCRISWLNGITWLICYFSCWSFFLILIGKISFMTTCKILFISILCHLVSNLGKEKISNKPGLLLSRTLKEVLSTLVILYSPDQKIIIPLWSEQISSDTAP